jgi:hypothetical protein
LHTKDKSRELFAKDNPRGFYGIITESGEGNGEEEKQPGADNTVVEVVAKIVFDRYMPEVETETDLAEEDEGTAAEDVAQTVMAEKEEQACMYGHEQGNPGGEYCRDVMQVDGAEEPDERGETSNPVQGRGKR